MNKEPSVLTRMRLSCCWGDNLNEKELNEVVDYINYLQQENKELKENCEDLFNQKEMMFKNMQLNQLKVCELAKVLDEIREYINSNPNVFYDEYLIDVETLKNNECVDETVGEIKFISNLLQILDKATEQKW